MDLEDIIDYYHEKQLEPQHLFTYSFDLKDLIFIDSEFSDDCLTQNNFLFQHKKVFSKSNKHYTIIFKTNIFLEKKTDVIIKLTSDTILRKGLDQEIQLYFTITHILN